MNSNQTVRRAVLAILGAQAAAYAAQAQQQEAAESDTIADVVVTATLRAESLQNVPIAVQALTTETLKQLSVTTFDDYIRYVPNVTAPSNGPGQGNIFMRGLSVGQAGSQSSGTIGGFPNVAIYLDEQSGQLPARNLDIYAADLERIEILEGPQGVTFGAGAQAGVVRYITNKPKLDKTEGSIDGGYGTTAQGGANSDLTAVLNVPLIENKLAIRGVIYNDKRGGYIDNVPGTFTRKATDLGIYYAKYATSCSGGAVPTNGICPPGSTRTGNGVSPNWPVINNNAIANKDINPVTYQGLRVQALYQVNDDWNVLIAQSYQSMEAQGVFYQMPNASDGAALDALQVTLFNNSFNKDKFSHTALTVNGRLGPLSAIYSGGYLVRNVDQVGDYTNYARGVYADYYQCYGPGTGFYINGGAGDPNLAPTCFSPSTTWREVERNEHTSHELRLSTPDDWRFRGIIGAFYEQNELFDQTDWLYKTIPNCTANGAFGTPGNSGCLSNVSTAAPRNGVNATVEQPGLRNDNTAFFEDTTRRVKQTALFVSLDYDLIPEVLTLTAGTRYFEFDKYFKGSVTSSFSCFEAGTPAGGCNSGANNLDARNLTGKESGFRSRGNITWHATPDIMVYGTWSEGFRPGGFNRTNSCHIRGRDLVNQFCLPQEYLSDDLTNLELGWKTQLLDRHLQFNGALYQENWDNVQIGFFNPGETGNLTFGTNGQNFRIRGIETQIVARLQGLTVEGSASWNESVQTNSPRLIASNPASSNFGNPITEKCTGTVANPVCTPINNLFGLPGSPSANAPPLQFSLRARYEWSFSGFDSFVQAGMTHIGHSFTQSASNPSISAGGINTTFLRFENPAYSTYDASFGLSKDAWSAHVFAQNLTNVKTSLFTNSAQFVVAETALRPRVIGLKLSYKF